MADETEEVAGEMDHVGRVHALWHREMPEVNVDGSAILARARRITLMARGKILALLSRYDLDSGEFYVLAALRRAGAPYALRPTELFRSLMVSSGGMTDRLRRLEKRGLVRRWPSAEDKRSMMVELTPEGCRLIEQAWREDMELENEIVASLGSAERQLLAGLLERLARLMELEETEHSHD